MSGSTFTSGATDFNWDTLENVLWKFVPGKPAVIRLLSDEVSNFAEQCILVADEVENFAEQKLNEYSILLDNRQKFVEKKPEKSELFFLKPE